MKKLVILFFLLIGCYSKSEKEVIHLSSCGVDALKYHIFKSKEQISFNILHSEHNYKREILSIFNREALGITFPEEIINELHKDGLKTTVLIGDDFSLRRNCLQLSRCIILLKSKSDAFKYHWESSPFIGGIEIFGENNTEILMIIWIHK